MHLYVLLRGIKSDLDKFVNDCLAQFLPYEYERGKMGSVQMAMRPIQLYEVVFPEDQLQEVVEMMKPTEQVTAIWGGNKYIGVLRRLLGAEKIPKNISPKTPNHHRIVKGWVQCMPIGIKRDIRNNDGIELL